MESAIERDASEAADAARRQLVRAAPVLRELRTRLQTRPPSQVVTCARGSSDHAATYGKYLIEMAVGRVVASAAPSVVSVYGARLDLAGALVIVVSQSGRSPDLVRVASAARDAQALVVGMINDEASPLAHACELVIPLCAGDERAVAATKSFLLAGLAFVQLVAAWTGDPALADAAARAPDALAAAAVLDWDLAALAAAPRAYVLGRGLGLAAALEIALKLKETCRIHAEAFSSAEVLHGPLTLVEPDFPVLALGQHDATADGMRAVLARLVSLGADVWSTLDVPGAALLPTLGIHVPPVLEPLCQVLSCYLALPRLAAARGLDADRPRHLVKVTETI
jgi:glucosamine--fructose-6-phosphate aminotransferase (isomerizing)